MRLRKLLPVVLLVVAGCGQELTAGGYDGRVETVVVDDPGPSGGSASSRADSQGRFSLTPQLIGLPSGEVEVEASAVLVGSDGSTTPLTSGRRRTAIAIAAGDSSRLDSQMIDVGRYVAVEVTFHEVTANLTTGLLPVPGQIRVALTEPVTIRNPVELEVTSGSEHSVVIDLNSTIWLLDADPALKIVSAAAFRSAVRLSVQ